MDFLVSSYTLRPINMLELIVISTLAFSCLLLWQRPRFKGLTLLLVQEILLMAFNFSEETGFWRQQHLVTPIFSLWTGPTFYLFIRHLVFAHQPWRVREGLHLLPALLALPFTHYTQAVLAVGTVSLVGYGVASFLLVRRYHRALRNMRADPEALQLRWLLGIMLAFALLAVTDAVRVNSQPYLDYTLRNSWYLLQQLANFCTFLTLVYLAIRQPALFDQLDFFERQVKPVAPAVDQPALEQQLFEQIDRTVRSHQLFRTPRLSLQDVAEKTGLVVRDVSTAINQGGGQSFSDYINGLRVEFVTTQLRQPERPQENLLQLAMDAGFNSKTAFNTAFRQHCGMTPSQFIKQLQN
ncbi:AraC family transcriptional regulator [Microbulbifer thermotolerans]|uniref:helix-turn-helix domain-containing protein n=1 Tax=Microbulbifer thermotolerans TaxID=252514 RepID=UPI00224955B6|nr:AraC family transcriptional regulator [Microbulbifer thermotolerans]MCX2782882.1 AraC family transcriptional regulator [Microbulbifer thermotolerans]MCX2830756.1 AraC family transcriptional regulator [Microbulbifer thermotolerans]MCX2833361.1 AraC family transcriptional regulator [Microbulbifer thermotolerans]MCX2840945.1 AraC family transcriptional regulator [Microbulbifer thermotolerans]WKT60563.1 AraC family transcriptional regulator [Microbulbifer thermotolerans]